MNPQQLSTIYDEFPEDQKDIPKEQFIKRAMNTIDQAANADILDQMVQGKRRMRQAQVQKAVIDSAITRGPK